MSGSKHYGALWVILNVNDGLMLYQMFNVTLTNVS
jgi:hypothetical protein